MNNEVIFVVSQTEIYRNDAALDKLRATNDSTFADEQGEILSVDAARWQQAQAYERSTWMDANKRATADRNGAHADAFNGYRALPNKLGALVELGCGVFTNLGYILDGRSADSITLVDPLLDTYRSHPNCTYADGAINGQAAVLVSAAIEHWSPEAQFDTVVMVNVLHHCRDARAVLGKLWSALRDGGLLIFHEPPREIDPETHYDAGHPLAPHAAFLNDFLAQFEEIYREGWHFIGRKPAPEAEGDPEDTAEAPVVEVKAPAKRKAAKK